jgi:hypothetical protein|tara:strand:+ start:993 stop:1148 length:156 start_codon:yes stop_codon:yes gene_type:complete
MHEIALENKLKELEKRIDYLEKFAKAMTPPDMFIDKRGKAWQRANHEENQN